MCRWKEKKEPNEKDGPGHHRTVMTSLVSGCCSAPHLCLHFSMVPVKGTGGRADVLWAGLVRAGSIGERHSISPAAASEPGLGVGTACILGVADGSSSTQPACVASPTFSSCVFFPMRRGPRRQKEKGWNGADGRQKTSPAMQSSSWGAHYPALLLITLWQCEGHWSITHM